MFARWLSLTALITASAALSAGCSGKNASEDQAAEDDFLGAATSLEVATMEDTPDIAQIQPGDLSAPPSGGGGDGLTVLLVGPQGQQTSPRQALAVFDRPMVALTDLDSGAAKVPLRCEAGKGGPPLKGKLRWAGTSTAVWLPEGDHVPRSTAVNCTVPQGAAALDGTKLQEAVSFGFETARPSLVSSTPYDGSDRVGPGQPLMLVFDQPIDLDALQEHLRLSDARGKKVAFKLKRPPLNTEVEDPDQSPSVSAERQSHSALIEASLALDSAYTMTVDPGFSGTEGPLGTTAAITVSFRTVPPAAVSQVEPVGDAVDPYTTIRLELATQTDAEELGGHISITPAPPDGWNPAEAYSWSSWNYSLRLAPMTTYTVTVSPGAKDRYAQTYTKGASWTFTTGHLSPLLDAPTQGQVYPASNPSTVPVRSRNLRVLHAGAKRVDAQWAIQNLRNWRTWSWDRQEIAGSQTLFEDGQQNDRLRVDMLDLAPHLQKGRGLVLVEFWSPQVADRNGVPEVSRSLLQVTDLGVTLKIGPDGETVWVTRLSDGQPVGDATVSLHFKGEQVWTGRTDKEGLAIAPPVTGTDWRRWEAPLWAVVEKDGDQSLAASEDPNNLPTWSYDIYASDVTEPGDLRMYAFADRGVYRPGDVAHVALTARRADRTGLVMPSGAELTWACEDAQSNKLASGKGSLDAHGAASFDVSLPEGAALGTASCSVSAQSGALESSAWVSLPVHAYRAPTFRVDVSAPDTAVAGAEVKASGGGRYLFGAPMANAEVSWAARSQVVAPQPRGWDEFNFAGASGRAWWDQEYQPESLVSSGEGKLDAEGQVAVQVTLPVTEEPQTRALTTEVTVIDVSRQRISNRAITTVYPSQVLLGLKPATSLGSAGKETGVDFIAVDPTGQARSGVPVTLTASRRSWDVIRQKGVDGRWTWVSTPKDEVIKTETLSSGAKPTRFSFTPSDGGWYVVRAEARDSEQRLYRSEDGLYVAGAGVSWARGDNNNVELVADKALYQPGDVAHVLVKAPRPGLKALVTVEREGVLRREVRTLATAAEALDIALGEDAVPNVFVSVLLVEGAPPADSPDAGMPSYYLGYTTLSVDPAGRRLAVEISSDQEVYQPGQEVSVTLKATRGGKPAADAHVVLYAVDYGVLSLTAYETPDAFGSYYAHHPLRVATADNRTVILDRAHFLAKGAEVGGGGGLGDGTRSRFITTPLWEAGLVTGKDGTLKHRFKLPDNLTTFQIMAVVDHDADAFGSASRQVRVSRPLIASPALPRVLRVGDKALAGVVVHNNRETARQVTVTAEARGLSLSGSPTTVSVPAGGAVEVPFKLTDAQPGEAVFRFEVTAEGDRDAVEAKLPVVRPQPAETVATTGVADPDATEQIAVPGDALAGVGGLTVQLAPTVMVGADASARYLLDYPHGCLEQTSSRLYAAILAKELGDRLDLGVPESQLQTWIDAGLARIDAFRHASGGLTLWPGGAEPDALATAAAVEALARAGRPVPQETIHFLRSFLAGHRVPRWWSAEMRRSAQARVALTLARLNQGDPGYNSVLYDQRKELSLTAHAELLETLARTTGKDRRTGTLIEEIGGSVRVEAAVATVRDQDDWTALWDGEMASTAATVSALLVAQPEHPLLPRLARGLVTHRGGGYWSNTWTTLRGLRALGDYVSQKESAGMPKGASATLAGAALFNASFNGPKAQQSQTALAGVKSGALQIKADGGPVYYEARMSYAAASMPPRDEGFTLTRSYAVLEGTGTGGQVTPGALVQVTLRVVTPVDRANVAVLDPLPAGLEPVDTFFATTASSYDEEDEGGQDSGGYGDGETPSYASWVFSHRELRDDAVALYADYMPAGVHTWQYLARATTPGDYALPAATVEEMYRPEIFGRTEATRFVVGRGPVAKASP